MQIKIIERNFKIPEEIKAITRTKVERFRKFANNVHHIEVALEKVKYIYKVDVSCTADHVAVTAKSEHEDLLSCIDDVVAKMERRLRRHKEKIIDRKKHSKVPPSIEEDDDDEEI